MLILIPNHLTLVSMVNNKKGDHLVAKTKGFRASDYFLILPLATTWAVT